MRLRLTGLIATLGCLTLVGRLWGDETADDAFFEAKVRPLLIAKCLECHSSEKPKAGLRLDSREAILTGGESGPAAITGKPDESLLVDVIGYRNTVQMPPKAKLPDADIVTLTEWVRRGLPWPNSKPTTPGPAPAQPPATDYTDEQKAFWAFQPMRHPFPPAVHSSGWIRSPIDQFILAELEAKGLTVAREADRRTLVRRVTLDLIGLPPTPDEVTQFVQDPSEDALERLVDRLLASPRYGERWGRHWLDVARYADSNGLDENLAYANAFRYRDYVVKALREDKPYDRFLTEQIAGDLLIKAEPENPASESESFDPLVATGFLCLGAKMLAEDDPVKMQMDIIDEQVDTIARAVMGLTMGCARCHDHKFDPLSTEDYYGLAGMFKSTQTMETFSVVARWHERPLATARQLQQRDEQLQQVATKKQEIEQQKTAATEVILSAARQHGAAYLLAATREFLLADQLSGAKPRGNLPNPQDFPGAILIEAEDFTRGNVQKDRETYGKEIGVLVNRGEAPNFTEYDIHVEHAESYQFELRYAAAGSRPVKIFCNGLLIKPDAAAKVTGSWTPETQTWFVECLIPLKAGQNLIRLEQPQFFPHLDKLLLTPAPPAELAAVELPPAALPDEPGRTPLLIPSITQQWVKSLEASKSDSQSILSAWHQFLRQKSLTINPATPNDGVSQLLVLQLRGQTPPTSLAELAQRYDQLFGSAQAAWKELKASDAGREAKSLPDPVLEAARSFLLDPKGPLAAPADIETLFSVEVAKQIKGEREELARREASIPKFAETMAVSESKPENLKIHLRGSHLTLGREASRQLPRILSTAADGTRFLLADEELTVSSGRLSLARWLTRPDHPLTARVMVNRIWQWHFGQGLVRSPDNFGRLGERPSHPALLDWLANEFSGNRPGAAGSPRAFSLKATHRALIASATYRQSAEYNSEAALADPENRLLWRAHRQRMDVEVLRDSLLALSGQLDESPGGSLLPTPNRNYVTSTANVNPAVYNSNRRSIYLPVVRSALYDVFTAFDFADPSTLAGQRDQTTVAPQALFMMNSSFVLDQVRVLAAQMTQRKDLELPTRLRQLYQLSYSRDPSEGEVARAVGYLDRIKTTLQQSGVAASEVELRAWVSLCRALLSANEFIYVE